MPDNNEAKWYIIHTFGGYEKKVKTSIENYARAQGMEDIIQQVYLPTDIVVETKNGKRKEVEKLRFPNYLFLKLVYGNNDKVDKDLWYKIRNTNGVTGFVAPDPNKPSPMTEEDQIKMGLIVPTSVEVDTRSVTSSSSPTVLSRTARLSLRTSTKRSSRLPLRSPCSAVRHL